MPRKPVPPQSVPTLSNAEWDVMKVLWDQGELAARDVYAALKEESGWANTTVKTILSRLVAKGAVEYKQIGNSYLYWAKQPRERVTRKEVKGFLDRVMDGALSPFMAHFIREADLSKEDIAHLKRILSEKEEKPAKRKKK